MTRKDDIIKSEKSEEMLSYILPFYDNDEYIMHVFQALGIEYDKLFGNIKTFFNQPFPERATWSLDYWEQLFGIPNGDGKTISERRGNITDFINAKQPINRNRIEVIASGITNGKVIVEEYISNYTFHVILVSDDFSVVNRDAWKAIYDAKPAHLAVKYYVKIGDNLYYYDIVKKTIAPVIKYNNTIGIGRSSRTNINVDVNYALGTGQPYFSSELRAGHFEVDPSQSRNRTINVHMLDSLNLGTHLAQNIEITNEQQARSKGNNLSMDVITKSGNTNLPYCGTTYSKGGD